ncbi:MAG: universal stress protein [Chamaesiphon sp.]|nr:universal stress protein [Chamaesiphon sp.]
MDRLPPVGYANEPERLPIIQAEILQSFGDTGPTICTVAKTWGADLIIMGRNQKSVLTEIFLGSTSNDVLHHAHCSVLIIQPSINPV